MDRARAGRARRREHPECARPSRQCGVRPHPANTPGLSKRSAVWCSRLASSRVGCARPAKPQVVAASRSVKSGESWACPPLPSVAALTPVTRHGSSTTAMCVSVRSLSAQAIQPTPTHGAGAADFILDSRPREHQSGTAATFDQARADLEAALRVFLCRRREADFRAWRRQRDWTVEK